MFGTRDVRQYHTPHLNLSELSGSFYPNNMILKAIETSLEVVSLKKDHKRQDWDSEILRLADAVRQERTAGSLRSQSSEKPMARWCL